MNWQIKGASSALRVLHARLPLHNTTKNQYNPCIIADTIYLSISRSILPSPIKKTARHLNSFHLGLQLTPKEAGPFFKSEPLGYADCFPQLYTRLQTTVNAEGHTLHKAKIILRPPNYNTETDLFQERTTSGTPEKVFIQINNMSVKILSHPGHGIFRSCTSVHRQFALLVFCLSSKRLLQF